MNVVSDEHKATLRQWHEELQERRGLRASLRRSATLNDVCLSEGFHSLMVQTHSLVFLPLLFTSVHMKGF